MPRLNVVEVLAGTTIKTTYTNLLKLNPDSACSILVTGSETVVSSVAAVSSGGGQMYALHTLPNTSCWYVNRWHTRSGISTYVAAQYLKALVPEVD